MTGNLPSEVTEAIRRTWGFTELRPLQAEAIRTGLEGRDSLVVLPTGGGKSLCYQVPPLVTGRTDLVVSPLIALMKDQVDGLVGNGYPAVAIHGGQTDEERREAMRALEAGEARLVFVAPERLVLPSFLDLVDRTGIRSFAIDEAHCISHWGHDFRPRLPPARARSSSASPTRAVHAFTATATQRVREDIAEAARARRAEVLVGRFDRPNLVYRIVPRSMPAGRFDEIARAAPRRGR
jgi:ATP-dependent DNA helicase RecQ